MTNGQDGGDTSPQQFIVAGPPDLLQQVVADLDAAPDATVLRVAGDPAAPERATVTMPPAEVDRLEHQYGGELTIEPDLPLTPYA